MRRGLVLGGGGTVGVAWEAALLGGLAAAGVDLGAADAIVGTSAGAMVGAWVAMGDDPAEVGEARRRSAASGQAPPSQAAAALDPSFARRVFELWGSAGEMTEERCAEIGGVALAAPTAGEDACLAGFADLGAAWPERAFSVCAVDCKSGRLRVFARDDGVPLYAAVAASCAVPGLFPPVEIEGRRYTDGSIRSSTSADVVDGGPGTRVLIVAPMAMPGGAGIRGLSYRQLAVEQAALEAAGADVRAVIFDELAAGAGASLMDRAAGEAVAAAARAHAARIGGDLAGWWRA